MRLAVALLFVQALAVVGVLCALLMQLWVAFDETVVVAHLMGVGIAASILAYPLFNGSLMVRNDDWEVAATMVDVALLVVGGIAVAIEGGDWAWAGIVAVLFLWVVGFLLEAAGNAWGEFVYVTGTISIVLGLVCAVLLLPVHVWFALGRTDWMSYLLGLVLAGMYGLLVAFRFSRQTQVR